MKLRTEVVVNYAAAMKMIEVASRLLEDSCFKIDDESSIKEFLNMANGADDLLDKKLEIIYQENKEAYFQLAEAVYGKELPEVKF